MTIEFYKYQATGNDFIMIDNRDLRFTFSNEQISQLCHRKFGIGADGLILIQNHDTCDFEMIYYNPDGSQSLCGNGSRCAVKFADFLGLIDKKTTFVAYDGEHTGEILPNDWVKLKMKDVQNVRPVSDGIFIDTGSPHLVKFVINLQNYKVYKEGKLIRNGGLFKSEGVNVNFVETLPDNQIFVRTYERGVEDETMSCGTGVTAAAIASLQKGYTSPVKIKTLGGNLEVEFASNSNNYFSKVHLIGPAEEVFKGTYQLAGN